MQLTFHGAARTVTGSCHLLTLDDGRQLLFDCGMYQGSEADMRTFNEDWGFEPSAIDAVLLSHAHIDHAGRLPKLVKDGFTGDIYCTPATRDLCAILLTDSAYLQERDAYFENKYSAVKDAKPLYTVRDVQQCMEHFVTVPYGRWYSLLEDVEVLFRDNGHILGSASVTIRYHRLSDEKVVIGFTGDIGRPNRPILKEPKHMPACDYLICEATYGDRLHETAVDEKERLLAIVQQTCVAQKGKLMIPAFSVGRTQEIVYLLDQLEHEGRLPRIPVFVDSPLAINATEIFRMHPECFGEDLVAYMHADPDPFGFNHLHYIRDVEYSKQLNTMEGPAIIISAAGMMEGGRIRHHIFNHIEEAHSTLLIVGFCAPGTLGERLRNGAKTIQLMGEEKQVKARVEIMDTFSAHGDWEEMIDFLSNQDRKKLKRLFLVHGEYEVQLAFRDKLMESGIQQIEIPSLGQTLNLH